MIFRKLDILRLFLPGDIWYDAWRTQARSKSIGSPSFLVIPSANIRLAGTQGTKALIDLQLFPDDDNVNARTTITHGSGR